MGQEECKIIFTGGVLYEEYYKRYIYICRRHDNNAYHFNHNRFFKINLSNKGNYPGLTLFEEKENGIKPAFFDINMKMRTFFYDSIYFTGRQCHILLSLIEI